MDKKDLATAEAIIKEANSWGFIFTHNKEDEVREMIYAALTTARKDAREAAFREIRERVEAVNPQLTFGSANGSMMKKCILAEIEAAANTEEGAGDADISKS